MSSTKKHIVIIGGGIGGLATAILLAKQGRNVSLYEQLDDLGGKARQFRVDGFRFDMGPSWYLMPKVFEHFYTLIGEDIQTHLNLKRLSPAYKVFFEKHDPVIVRGELKKDAETFESIEPGAGANLEKYIQKAGTTYHTAIDSFLYTNFNAVHKFVQPQILKSGPFMARVATQSIDSYVSSYFRDNRLKQIMEYPMVFLGASPYNAPALYHLMSYMDFEEGVFYPEGGIYSVIESLIKIAKKYGVKLHTNKPVNRIIVEDGKATGIELSNTVIPADIVISNADLHFTETRLLPTQYQSYPEGYWQKRTAGPSALLFYMGIKGSLPQLEHHNLYFSDDWHKNFTDIFDNKTWPRPASMYICKPSATDTSVAPKNHENVFILVPLPAKDMTKSEQATLTKQYFNQFKQLINEPDLDKRIIYQKTYSPRDFATDYNAWEGSALGLSHTLKQSALFRPRNKSKKVKNLYYVGGNTIPGVGLPMCLISAELIVKHLSHDKTITPLGTLPEIK
jgi:phytoene desaturase